MNYWKYTYDTDSDDYSQKDTISCGNAICHLRWQKNRNSPPPLDFFCLKKYKYIFLIQVNHLSEIIDQKN